MMLTDFTQASPTQIVDHPDVFLYLHHDRAQITVGTLVVFPDHHGGSYVLPEHLPRQWYKIFNFKLSFSTEILLLVSSPFGESSFASDVTRPFTTGRQFPLGIHIDAMQANASASRPLILEPA